MFVFILQGIGYGLAAAAQPGPFQTYLITQALKNGWRRTLPAALAPLLSDIPIVLLVLAVLSRVPPSFETALHIISGLFILYLAWGAFKAWRRFNPQLTAGKPTRQNVLEAAVMNLLNPNPYIFWSLVAGPTLLSGWRGSPLCGLAFLISFYATLIGGFALIIILFGTARYLGPRVNRMLLVVSIAALAAFGLYQLGLGISGL